MKQEFVTLPREVVEQALEAFDVATTPLARDRQEVLRAQAALRAALDQPKNHIEQHLRMVPAGWKLVPIEPTDDMLYDIQEFSHILPPRGKRIWAHMLAAAPQPPTTEQSSAVERPQSEQPAMTPIAQRKLDSLLTEGYTISGYSVYHEQKHQHGFVTGAGLVGWWKPEGMEYPQPQGEQEHFAWISHRALEWGTRQSEKVVKLTCKAQPKYDFTEPLYTHPQNLRCKSNQARLATMWGYVKPKPPRQPLTDEQIDAIADAMPGGLEGFLKGWGWRQFARAVLAATHNIK